MLEITRTSMLSGVTRTKSFDITEEQYLAWVGGKPINLVMPNLTPSEREFIISGSTDGEWDEYMKDHECGG